MKLVIYMWLNYGRFKFNIFKKEKRRGKKQILL